VLENRGELVLELLENLLRDSELLLFIRSLRLVFCGKRDKFPLEKVVKFLRQSAEL